MADGYRQFRKRVVAFADDLRDGEISETLGTDPEAEQFDDGYDEDLMGDAEDRARLQSFRREDMKRKLNIRNQLARSRLSSQQQEDSGQKERSQTRRQNLDDQRAGDKKTYAFGRLKAVRSQKLAKDKSLKAADIYSDDSSSSSGEESVSRSVSQPARTDQPQVTTREQLSQAMLARHQLESFLDKPVFEQTVVECFVRVNVGHGSANCVYQVVGLYRDSEDYLLGSKRTNLVLSLKHGAQKRYSRMDVVSNQPITHEEFCRWNAPFYRDDVDCTEWVKPTLLEIARKQLEIQRAAEYSFTEDDVDKLVQSKRTGGQRQRAAHQKIYLLMETTKAAALEDPEKVKRLERKIQQIDERQVEASRDHRVQVPKTLVPSICRPDLNASSGTKRSLADRQPTSEEFELEQCMRRKYKKSAVVSRSRVQAETADLEEVAEIPETPLAPSESSEVSEVPQLDLYALHNFKAVINTSGLIPFTSIFPNVKFNSDWKT
ncbi:RNA polymerase-associated protein RTF1 homolog [Drosophila elegans]|uniref:RNA polymerase-associated protein RTF1 homolog n=1 Tax=Drosophila elegans TaxID=30023 RepID=UPI0007E6F52A|nr:RNA polymerase-associated protein RTF1 homolog [Drosophila elegans]XP_041564806.1 RNA polymerase-associated protein RTF1 homolog [Drosophila elegans]